MQDNYTHAQESLTTLWQQPMHAADILEEKSKLPLRKYA